MKYQDYLKSVIGRKEFELFGWKFKTKNQYVHNNFSVAEKRVNGFDFNLKIEILYSGQ